MNPIDRAMGEFVDQADAFWRANPSRLLPLVAHEDQRGDVVQALRLYEARPENRHPVVVFVAPFEATSTYFLQLVEHVGHHYELVRKGAAEEGVELAPFGDDDGTVPSGVLKRAVLAMDKMARRLGERFDGVVIALVPEQIGDAAGWVESVRVLAATRWVARVRVAVLAPPGSRLSKVLDAEGAQLRVDPGEMVSFLKQRLPEAPVGSAPAVAATSQAVPEIHPGETPPTRAVGAKLQSLLLRAAEATGAGRLSTAVTLYQEARALCQVEQLVHQEAAVLMALGGVLVVGQVLDPGAESYRQAAILAESVQEWPLACQAWLGVGGAHLTRGDHASAVLAYRTAAAMAKHAEIAPLRIEALRLEGCCQLHLGREGDAMLAWNEAVEICSGADVAARRASTFDEVARALVKLLERHGLTRQAQHVQDAVKKGKEGEE